MQVDSLRQLGIALQAAGLGWALGLLYDLLRALRRRCRRRGIAAALDGLYALTLFFLVFFFALRVGGGELRLFLLAGLGLGALVFALFCSAPLRPLWELWVEAGLRLAHFAAAPLRLLLALAKNLRRRLKKLFHFLGKCYIMVYRKQYPRPRRRRGSSHGRH